MEARLIIDAPARGTWNMAVDEALFLTGQRSPQTILRFYGWAEPTLSLGYFQPTTGRDEHPSSRICPLVRRSTGGGAIVHDRELTYTLVMPLASDRMETQDLVRAVHESLIATLRAFGVDAYRHEASVPRSFRESEPFLCFQRRAVNDVFIKDSKVAGSAQRKLHRTLLQHGSILLQRSEAAPELAGIAELTERMLSPGQLAEAWINRLTQAIMDHHQTADSVTKDRPIAESGGQACRLERSVLTEREQAEAERLEHEKFATDSWNHKR